MQQIYFHFRKKTNSSVTSEIVELPQNVDDFLEFLRQFNLKRFNQHLVTRIIIDTSTTYR